MVSAVRRVVSARAEGDASDAALRSVNAAASASGCDGPLSDEHIWFAQVMSPETVARCMRVSVGGAINDNANAFSLSGGGEDERC